MCSIVVLTSSLKGVLQRMWITEYAAGLRLADLTGVAADEAASTPDEG